MRVVLVLEGRSVPTEVDLAAGTVEVEGRRFPFRLVEEEGNRAEIEIDGERVVVDGWPRGLAEPPTPTVNVDGEVVEARVAERTAAGPTPRATSPAAATPSKAVASDAILPPMPGRVIEVRVREGEAVSAGQLLLVLEAMKMRNEISSPRAGVVRDLRVTPGSNVRARDPMLRVVAP